MKIIVTVFTTILTIFCFGQNKPAGAKPKYQPPVITTILGTAKDSAGVTAESLKQMIKLPLKFVDNKNNTYTLSTYMLIYKRLMPSTNENDKVVIGKGRTGAVFNQSPLPEVWQKTLELDLKKGEELFFTDIIVKAANGNLYYAKNLKITVL